MRMVDTDVLVDYLRGHHPARNWFHSLAELPAVPGFVVMELIAGCSDEREAREIDQLVAPMEVIWPSRADCRRALSAFRRCHLSHGLGLLNALVAACAIGRGAPLYTFNAKHFVAMPELLVEAPYER